MSTSETHALAMDPRTALKLVDTLEKQAERTEDPYLKRILLRSSCEIIDHVLGQHMPATTKKAA
ncbi:hypothetical protein Mal4_24920 [Maioricimonas rarisocia]|uniref:Uncharacterized protein n=1 Tax=Maioricimonas rarisocia TaxID=2528026 RepID=A0A517Z6V6_9PLAN|nr:hypothetical protein [Maioricimonas rarisocia]QDU38169.1 hypothetical protein Mal4_24920 [Maioricimonas rarisocia]